MSTCQHDHIVRQHTRLRSAREMSFWTTSSRGVTPWGTSGTNPSTLSEWPRSRRVSSPPSPPPSPSYTCPSLETRVMGTEWGIPDTYTAFSFFILPLILFSDKYLLIFFYLILSYLQKRNTIFNFDWRIFCIFLILPKEYFIMNNETQQTSL